MHLQHLIPWSDLVPLLQIDPSEILLPIGECGRIHIKDKATEIKIEHRKFIRPEQICTVKDCKTIDTPGCFSKNRLSQPKILVRRRSGSQKEEFKKKLQYFREKFCDAVFEFVGTEEKKYTDEIIKNFKPSGPPELADMHCTECYGPCRYNCRNFIIFSLYTKNELKHLLWLDQKGEVSISDALCKNYGGQAVGNGYQFLVIYHLLPFYLAANAIIACGYESCEEKWGILSTVDKPWGFMSFIQHDCDFLTFIPSLRPYLQKDVFMKDMTKTKELLKEVFRHIYVYILLVRKFRRFKDDDWFRDQVKWEMSQCFGFKFDYN